MASETDSNDNIIANLSVILVLDRLSVLPLPHQTSLSVATDCNRLQPIGMLGVSPNFGANGSNTSVLLASRRENPYRL